jgi:hypothetical protein
MPEMNQMYQVSYQIPYNDCEWRSQYFNTLQVEKAQSMIEFYKSCGSPAKLVERQTSN